MSRRLHRLPYRICGLLIPAVLSGIAGTQTLYGQPGSVQDAKEPYSRITLVAQEQETTAEAEPAGGPERAEAEGEAHSVWDEIFHWTNFVLILGAVIYLLRKFLIPFLEERGRAIREDMDRSGQAIAEANRRLSLVEEKIQRLDEEIGALRQEASQEAAAERGRIEELAGAEANKILVAAEQEMEVAVKAARQDLKAYAAELALGVAERKIRESLTPQAEQRILRSFLQGLAGQQAGEGNGSSSQQTGEKS